MIHSIGFAAENELIFDSPLSDIFSRSFEWYWIDFDEPDESEKHYYIHFFTFTLLLLKTALNTFSDQN